ncbi:Sialate O-acetylesterase, partial [Balearica regulorum gibbericeps]
FASYYGDHMVLQKEPAGALVWGYGEPGAVVTVVISGDGGLIIMKKTARVKGPSGTWTTVLDPMDRGGPYALTAGQGSENVTLRDVYFGDVWLCSGQSNMAMTVLQIVNASQELAAAARYPYVRIFAAAPARSNVELEDLKQIDLPWSIPTAENLGHGNFTYFSAICWLLGRYLYEALRYPVGLVEAAWGGTPIEAWSSQRALQACGLPEDVGSFGAGLVLCTPLSPALSSSISPHWHLSGPQTPSVLWNAMIHPLLNMTLRAAPTPAGPHAFHAGSAGQTEPLLPFGFVQVRGSTPTLLRGQHRRAWVGRGIHPRDKQNVAHRLHLGARAVAYGEKDLVFQGPYPTRAVLEVTRALLNVTYTQELVFRRRDAQAFEVCCSSQPSPCRWLPAPVVAVESHTVTLALAGCGTLVLGLRYAWAEWPCEYRSCTLYNTQGLPAPPFL